MCHSTIARVSTIRMVAQEHRASAVPCYPPRVCTRVSPPGTTIRQPQYELGKQRRTRQYWPRCMPIHTRQYWPRYADMRRRIGDSPPPRAPHSRSA
eukprot:2376111-Rhodomonas_salina.2